MTSLQVLRTTDVEFGSDVEAPCMETLSMLSSISGIALYEQGPGVNEPESINFIYQSDIDVGSISDYVISHYVKSEDELSVYYVNAQSLRNKFKELVSYAIIYKYDIICITESWINELYYNDRLSEFEIQGYNMFVHQRKHRGGGGLVLYVNSDLIVKNSTDRIKQSSEVESLWIDISIKIRENTLNLRLGLFYRAPGAGLEISNMVAAEIDKAVEDIGLDCPVLILGDFNHPEVDWEYYYYYYYYS